MLAPLPEDARDRLHLVPDGGAESGIGPIFGTVFWILFALEKWASHYVR